MSGAMQMASAVEGTSLFAGLAKEEVARSLLCLGAGLHRYERGDVVIEEGEPGSVFGVVVSGTVQLERDDAFGNRTIISVVMEGETFCAAYAFAQAESMPISVVAREAAEVVLFAKGRTVIFCASPCAFHTRMIENMLGMMARNSIAVNDKLDVLSSRTTRGKIMAYLKGEARRAGGREVEVPLDRAEMADYLSVDRSAMCRELGRMKRDGLIDYRGRSFRLIKDMSE